MPAPQDILARLYAQLQQLLAANSGDAADRVLTSLSTSVFEQALLGATKTYLGWSQHTRRAFFYRLEQLGHKANDPADEDANHQERDLGAGAVVLQSFDGDSVTAREKLWLSVLAQASLALEEQTFIKVQRNQADGKRKYEVIPVGKWTSELATRALFQHFVAGLEEECGCSLRLDPQPPLGQDEIEHTASPREEHAKRDLGAILREFGSELRTVNQQAYFAARRWYWINRYTDVANVNQEIARQMMRREGRSTLSREELVEYTRDVVAPILSTAEAAFQQFCAAKGYAHLTRGDIKRSLRT